MKDQYFSCLICHTVVQFQAAFAKFHLVTEFCHLRSNSDEKEAVLRPLQPTLLTSLTHRCCVFYCSLNFLEKKQQSGEKPVSQSERCSHDLGSHSLPLLTNKVNMLSVEVIAVPKKMAN